MKQIEKDDFLEQLITLRECSKLVEQVFPGMFTEVEKVKLVARVKSNACLENISMSLIDDLGIGVTDRLWQIADNAEKS